MRRRGRRNRRPGSPPLFAIIELHGPRCVYASIMPTFTRRICCFVLRLNMFFVFLGYVIMKNCLCVAI